MKQINFNYSFVFLIFAVFLFNSIDGYAQKYYWMGPSGGVGGVRFDDKAHIPNKPLLKYIVVRYGAIIDGVQIYYNGGATPFHGGNGGHQGIWPEDHFQHDEKNNDYEYLTKVTGRLRETEITGTKAILVENIQFSTNKGRSSPDYGGGDGISGELFIYEAPEGYMIVGLQGRSGSFLDAVGVLIKKVPKKWKK